MYIQYLQEIRKMVTPTSNYRFSLEEKRRFKKYGRGNETNGIRFCLKLVKKLGLKEARKIVEGTNEHS